MTLWFFTCFFLKNYFGIFILKLKETKKMLRNNIKMFTQTRFDLLNQENLKSLQKFKRKKKENFID